MISKNKITYRGLAVWIVCASFFTYEFLLRTVLGTFQPALMSQLHLTPITFSILSSTAYQLIYGVMQIPVGLITFRFGIKRTLFTAIILCVIADVGFSLAHTFWVAMIFRTLMGLGSSFGFVCLLIAVYDWMPRKNIGLFIGLSQFIGTLGPMMAAGPLNSISENAAVSWREIFEYLGIVGVILSVFVLFVVDRNNKNKEKRVILKPPSYIFETFFQIIRQKQIWYIAVFSACNYFSLEYLSENECKAFLINKGFSTHFSAYMITMAWLGYASGCAVLGFISDRIQRRKVLMLNSAIVALVSLTSIIYLPLGQSLITLCFVLLGIGASGQSIGFAIMAEQCKENYIEVGLGFNNAMIVLFAAIISPLIGMILSHSSHLSTTLINQQRAFTVMIVLLIIAVILARFFIKETFCKPMRENIRLTRPRYSF